jgi:hypothetical protein
MSEQSVAAGIVPKEDWDRLGWHPRSYQSQRYVIVPAAMLEEVRDSLHDGDARSLLVRLIGDRT